MDTSPELAQFLEQEKQRMMMSEMVTKLTNVCWDKCITGTPGSKFSSGETTCLTNCAQRYLDMSMIIARGFRCSRRPTAAGCVSNCSRLRHQKLSKL
ncbi:hypothetical protein ZWY2020_008533 [Hordeum vulgare]|nr:hypothetical protein ZWY2020_008533 [Hordeum vulgare]